MKSMNKIINGDKNDNDNGVVFINEHEINKVLTWPMAFWAAEQSFSAVAKTKSFSHSQSHKMDRLICLLPNQDVFCAMPAFVTHFPMPKEFNFTEKGIPTEDVEAFGCKLLTEFPTNDVLNVPSILGTICLFDTNTGKMKAILDATTITSWRTAAATVIATQYLYFNPHADLLNDEDKIIEPKHLAIVGTGVQGRMHAIAMLIKFKFASITLWNQGSEKLDEVVTELNDMKYIFENIDVDIKSAATVKECVENADVIVTATKANTNLINWDMVKKGAHINAIGVNTESKLTELSKEVYANCKVYVDDVNSIVEDIKQVTDKIEGMVGDIIIDDLPMPSVDDTTIFQSSGIAVEDITLAKIIYEIHQQDNKHDQSCCSIM